MMETIEGMPEGCIGVRASGEVTEDDYKSVLTPMVDAATEDGAKVRLLYQIDTDLGSFSFKAMVQDTELGVHHLRDFERMALVTNSDGIRRAVNAFKFVIRFPIQMFTNDQLDQAKQWVASEGS